MQSIRRMSEYPAGCSLLLLLTLALPPAFAQTSASPNTTPDTRTHFDRRLTPGEQHAVRAFDRARNAKANALALEVFLKKMPKGGDLHMHLSGAIYAETFLKDAAVENLCVNPTTETLDKSTRPAVAAAAATPPKCLAGAEPAADAFNDQKLYDALVDAWSMRTFVPSEGISGHDQFFATFDRFAAVTEAHPGEWLNDVATRAARQNEQYLEVMVTPDFGIAAKLGYAIGWPATPPGDQIDPGGDTTGTSPAELGDLREKLLAGGLRQDVAIDEKQMDSDLAARTQIEHCGRPDAAKACSVKIRYLYQVLRAFPPQQVFAQTLLAFEVASQDPNVVGLNFVQPEDAYLAMSEYNRQMHMLDYLHSVYPRVHISLHAGELAPGLVPPKGLTFHIHEAIDLGHAERIGHGVDVMYEHAPYALLKEMADRHIMVEINLTSNAVILGVVPPYHPLPEYLAAHVPVALSTDDEGVSRIDLTHEYVRAAMEYGLGYIDLKTMARTSLQHSFLPGESLWKKPDDFTQVKQVCAGQPVGASTPSRECAALLKSSQKATGQWELEHRFSVFEAGLSRESYK